MVALPLDELERTAPLYERAYQRLQARILAGSLRAGDRLLDTQLAAQLGVSRTPVRDALRQLVRDRLAETDGGGRYFVARPDRRDFLEFCACRDLLEPAAAALAARDATPADLAALEASLAASSGTLRGGDVVAATRGTVDFHNLLAAATHNRLLAELLQFIRVPILPLRGILFADRLAAERTDREHRTIYEAVAQRDPAAAGEAARAHVQGDRERGLRALDQLSLPDPAASAGAIGVHRRPTPVLPPEGKTRPWPRPRPRPRP